MQNCANSRIVSSITLTLLIFLIIAITELMAVQNLASNDSASPASVQRSHNNAIKVGVAAESVYADAIEAATPRVQSSRNNKRRTLV